MPVRRMASSVLTCALDMPDAAAASSVTRSPDDAAKADVARGSVDGLGVTCRWPVAAAIIWRAQVRAALQHLAWDADVRLAFIVTALLGRTVRIFRKATGAWRRGLVTRAIPVGGPLPHVSDHVVESIAVGRIRGNRRGACVAVRTRVLVRKFPLPGVGHVPVLRRELIAPGIFRAIESAAGGEFPLRLSRQLLARPARIGLGVPVGDMHHGVVFEPLE